MQQSRLVVLLITETTLEPALVIYIFPLPELYATPIGAVPTVMLVVAVLVVLSITEIVLESELATYTSLLSGLYTTPIGVFPTGMVNITLSTQTCFISSKKRCLINMSKIANVDKMVIE